MKKIKLSDYVWSFVEKLGVREVFLISGGGNMHLIDSIGKSKRLKYVCNHHEQACAIAAEGYARATKNIGVCLTTTGPGATNAITGVSGGWLDSIPMLCISGQVNRASMITKPTMRQIGIQEINIVAMVKPMTKYAVVVTEPKDIRYHLEKAVYMAKTGRPGPSWLDIPLDVQASMIDLGECRAFDPVAEGLAPKPAKNLVKEVSQVVKLLRASKQPLILAGHGIHCAGGEKTFLNLLKGLPVPVATTISAPDLIPSDHPLFTGRPGGFGDRAGNFAVQNADLMIAIGARLHPWTTGFKSLDFGRRAKKVMVDIDPDELKKKSLSIDLRVEADARLFMEELERQLASIALPDISAWRKRCQDWRKKYSVMLPEYARQKTFVNSYHFVDELSKQLPKGALIVTGDGTAFTGTNQGIKVKKDQQVIFSVGCAAMGYDLPAAIGACFGSGKKETTLITGDGSIMLNIQELQTIVHYKLPIKIFLLNNEGYLAIRNTQHNYFNDRFVASDAGSGVSFPKFKKIAAAFDIPYLAMTKADEVAGRVREVLSMDGPVLCEIMMSPRQELNPRPRATINPDGTFVNRPLEDMYPYLSPEELAKNMQNN